MAVLVVVLHGAAGARAGGAERGVLPVRVWVFESAKSGSDNVSSTIPNISFLFFFTKSSHNFCNVKHKLQNTDRSQAPKRTPTFNYYINHAE